MIVYVIGSLRNPHVPEIAALIRSVGRCEAFDDWYAAGWEADDEHVFALDVFHLNRATAGVLILPAGRSGHLELGYLLGQGKPGYVLAEGPLDWWDITYQFAEKVFLSRGEMVKYLAEKVRDVALPLCTREYPIAWQLQLPGMSPSLSR